MHKKIHLIMLLAVAALLMGCGADQAIKKGDKAYALGEYFEASNQYKDHGVGSSDHFVNF